MAEILNFLENVKTLPPCKHDENYLAFLKAYEKTLPPLIDGSFKIWTGSWWASSGNSRNSTSTLSLKIFTSFIKSLANVCLSFGSREG